MQPPRLHALLPCAGTGSRAGTPQPKQYQRVAGQPMVLHTLRALAQVARLDAIVLAVSPDDAFIDSLRAQTAPATIVACGGATRAATVAQGLAALQATGAHADDWVLVHDAARCLVTADDVNRLIDACLPDAVGGLLAVPLADTLKQSAGGEAPRAAQTLVRSDKWLAQTPQMFRIGLLAQALKAAGEQVTDEASAVEALGHRPLLVRASAHNFKVTYPEDFALAEAVLRSRMP